MRLQEWRAVAKGCEGKQIGFSLWNTVTVPARRPCSSDEGGIQRAGVLRAARPSLKQLLDQGGFLLLQLGDALALLRHLLREKREREINGRRVGACDAPC